MDRTYEAVYPAGLPGVPRLMLRVKFSLQGGISRKRCIVYEVRPVRKLFNCGVYYHFLLALLILTALKLPAERRVLGY
jgi:hypothetical protein